MTKDEISDRFKLNLDRVKNLVKVYPGGTKGRKSVHHADILRAAIVLLHATLEDLLRSYLILKIDDFSDETMDSYGFPSDNKRGGEKFKISELAKYKRMTVEDFIVDAIKGRIENYETFNNISDIKKALNKCSFPKTALDSFDYMRLDPMIARRHQIVHKADKNEGASGKGNHHAASIAAGTVSTYILSVQDFKIFVSTYW